MSVGVFAGQVVHIVGADRLQSKFACDAAQGCVDLLLLLQAMVLQLEVEVVGAKNIAVCGGGFQCSCIVLVKHGGADLTADAAAQHD